MLSSFSPRPIPISGALSPKRTVSLICHVAMYISMVTSFAVLPDYSSTGKNSGMAGSSSSSSSSSQPSMKPTAPSPVRRVVVSVFEQTPSSSFSSSSSSSPVNNQDNIKPEVLVPQQADFELQELKIQLRAMKEQALVTANQLQDEKRGELEGYVRRIIQRRSSPVPLWQMAQQLPSTQWRLGFSTQASTNQSLPPGTLVYLQFAAESEDKNDDDEDDDDDNHRKMEYTLEFTKTLGLQKLIAESTYQVDSSPVHPGWVTYTYDRVKTDVLGFQNVGLPVGGLLKGRTAVIQTIYFDGEVWIESGKDGSYDYFNVYVRELEDDDWNA